MLVKGPQVFFIVGILANMSHVVKGVFYTQALTVSNEARRETTVGEIVNLMSVDAERLRDCTGYLWMLWSCPLQISIALYLLYNLLGPSVFAGLGVMILLVPVNGGLAAIMQKLEVCSIALFQHFLCFGHQDSLLLAWIDFNSSNPPVGAGTSVLGWGVE